MEVLKGSVWREIFAQRSRVKVKDVYIPEKGVLKGKSMVKVFFMDKKDGPQIVSYKRATFEDLFSLVVMIVQKESDQ